jgi:DNA-binding NtrC family response regulator
MKIGVVTWDAALQQVLRTEIQARGHEVAVFDDLLQALDGGPQLVFAQAARGARLAALLRGLREAAARAEPLPVIVLLPMEDMTLMLRMREAGAADVLLSPPDPQEIRAEIAEVGEWASALDMVTLDRFRDLRQQHLVGECANFRRCLDELRKAAKSDANVLLLGETGTGKEMFAQAIHELSRRAANPYVAVNCAGLPTDLLESELFGHVKGAFTDAKADRTGRFQAVGAGTLLLDEIGDIPPTLQVKLLRVIEQRIFQRVGENKDVPFYARLISATSIDLEAAILEGRFRRDLLGRIDQFRVVLPPLRERRADIPILARHFLDKHTRGRLVDISKTAMEVLEAYDFPMNVRQLENAVIGALARSDPGEVILPKHLPEEVSAPGGRAAAPPRHTISIPQTLSYKEAREYAERAVDDLYLNGLLRKHGGNQTRAAEEARIDRETFGKRIRQAPGQEDGHDE